MHTQWQATVTDGSCLFASPLTFTGKIDFYLFSKLQQFDLQLMQLINQKLASPWQNQFVPWLRYQQFWYPFYIFLVAFALINFGKKGWWWIAGFILTVSASDLISSRLIKNSVQRLRPCRDPEVMDFIMLRIPHCSGGYSFTSSHAANHFSMAMFIFVTMSPLFGKKTGWIFLWSASIAYAQVYVGVHYPLDVLCGALVGMLVGWITGNYMNRRHPLKDWATR